MATRIAICNEALASIGELPLQTEAADNAAPVLLLYDRAVRQITGSGSFSFTRVLRRLARDTASPDGPWTYRFQLPAEQLEGPQAIFDSETATIPFLRWELRDNGVYADVEELWARVRIQPSPAIWPPLFREAVTTLLSSHLALSMKDDKDLAQLLYRVAMGDPAIPGDMGLCGKARVMDTQAQPSKRLMQGTSPLIAARR